MEVQYHVELVRDSEAIGDTPIFYLWYSSSLPDEGIKIKLTILGGSYLLILKCKQQLQIM